MSKDFLFYDQTLVRLETRYCLILECFYILVTQAMDLYFRVLSTIPFDLGYLGLDVR